MNLRDAAEIVNASITGSNFVDTRSRERLSGRRTPRMILSDIRAAHAALAGLYAELEGRLPDE